MTDNYSTEYIVLSFEYVPELRSTAASPVIVAAVVSTSKIASSQWLQRR